jgi:L-seryl-tRNA(Ser) seleniumtransferase
MVCDILEAETPRSIQVGASPMSSNPLRKLPSVATLLETPSLQSVVGAYSHEQILECARLEVEDLRQRLVRGEELDGRVEPEVVAAGVLIRLDRDAKSLLREVINATGIILHTNLGRSPIAEEAARAAYDAARGYLNLEIDLESGKRSSRQNPIRHWVCRLTGAESATAVNNCAAATVIVLRALCAGKEVIVSRGQLIEIGGSFRIPEIMGVSGATLREVGTTNITRIADYERAIGPNTGALMRVHTSNYRVSGFTKAATLDELVALCKKHGLPVIDDLGSGAMVDFSRFGFQGEPVARESLAAGADVILFSGDKLLGGPQAGIIAGRKELIQKIEKDPLMRALRLDKMTLAALEATLRLYFHEQRARQELPGLRMLSISVDELRQRCHALAGRMEKIDGVASATVAEDTAFVGGGSLPDQEMKTCVIEIAAAGVGDAEFARRLRTGYPAVIGRLREGKLLIDLRTVFSRQEESLIEAVRKAVGTSG